MRSLYEPLVAELPHRTANDIFKRFTGVDLSSRGAQSIIDSTAKDLREWRKDREAGEVFKVSCLLAQGEDLVVEVAMDGVMAGMRWKTPGFLSVVELRVARLNGTDREFWANRGLLGRAAA